MTTSATAAAEVTGLANATAYATGMCTALTSAASGAQAFAAGLSQYGVSGPAVTAIGRAQELTAQAGAAWVDAVAALGQQELVRAAYAAAPGAGSKGFLTDGASATPTPSDRDAAPPPTPAAVAPGVSWRVDEPREPGILTVTDTDGSTEVDMTRDELFELVDVLDKLSRNGTSHERMKLERGGEICWGEDWGNPSLVNLTVFGDNGTSATLALDPDALDELRSQLNTRLRQQRAADEKTRAGGPARTSQQVTAAGTTVEQTSGVGWSAGPVRKPGLLAVTGDDGRVEVPMRRYEVSQFIDVLTDMGVGSTSTNRMELENGGDIWWGEWEEGDDGSLLLPLSISGADHTYASLALDPHALDDLRIHLKQQLADDASARARAAGIAPSELNPDDLLQDDDEDTYAAAATEHRKMANWFATKDQSDRDYAAGLAWWTRAANTLDAAAARAGQQPIPVRPTDLP